jgi:hypothetical protein
LHEEIVVGAFGSPEILLRGLENADASKDHGVCFETRNSRTTKLELR